MVTQTNARFFKRFEALLDENLEKDIHKIMTSAVESEAKMQVYGQGSIDAAVQNQTKSIDDRLAYNSHNDTDEYHPAGHLNRVTGTLGRSINTETVREGDTITSVVGTNVKYARIHELGGDIVQHRISSKGNGYTMHIRIPARPFLIPAMELRKDEVMDYLKKRVTAMVRMASK